MIAVRGRFSRGLRVVDVCERALLDFSAAHFPSCAVAV